MKNYRLLIPIVAIALMFVGGYLLISNASDSGDAVSLYLAEAEMFKEQKLYNRASEHYAKAIEEENNYEYYFRAADMFYEIGDDGASAAWAQRAVDAFPTLPEAYEKLIRAKIRQKRLSEAYEVLDSFEGRKLSSSEMDKYKKELETAYYRDYAGIENTSIPSGGYVRFQDSEGLYGLATQVGGTVVEARFPKMGFYANKMVAVQETDGTWFMMDSTGDYQYNLSAIYEGEISDVGMLSYERLPMCIDGAYVYTDLKLNEKQEKESRDEIKVLVETKILSKKYEYAGSFSSGLAAVQDEGKWYVISPDFERVAGPYTEILLDERGVCCQKGFYFAKKDGKFQLYNKDGDLVNKNEFDDARLFIATEEDAAVKIGTKWGFINQEGNVTIKPIYDDAKSFSCGLAPVKTGEFWGYINPKEEMIIPAELSDANSFTDKGTAYVQEEFGWRCYKLYKYNH